MAIEWKTVLGGIPFTTITILGILAAFRRDLMMEMIESNSSYFGLSQVTFVFLCIFIVIAIMAAATALYYLYTYLRDNYQRNIEAQRLYAVEEAALVAIFNALNGARWKDRTRWCSQEPISRWKGVHIDPVTKRVNKLILPENELEGGWNTTIIVHS